MDVVYTYSHLGGEEILMVRFPELDEEIAEVIAEVPNPGRSKKSKEATKKGKALYPPKEINKSFKESFAKRGWNEIRDYFSIELPDYPPVVKNSYKQCDFLKGRVVGEVQFGKYAFMFYDLAKFQYFYNMNKISVGVEIVPCHFLHKQMSSGVSFGEQLVYDLERLSKNFPSVPVKIILVDMPIDNSDDYCIEGRKEARSARRVVEESLSQWRSPDQEKMSEG